MNKTITINKLAKVDVIKTEVPYSADPTRLFHTLCENKTDSLLLESAEIDSKQNLKSLLIVDSAVRIVCYRHQVTMTALTDNGKALLSHVKHNINSAIKFEHQADSLTLNFTEPCNTLDEDSRLREASSFDALRLIQHSFDLRHQDKHALFLGGLFAYDLVANFEPLGEAKATNQCPDYVFYVAETLLVVDHQTQSCQLQATRFDVQSSAATIEKRLLEIAQACSMPKALPDAEKVDNLEPIASVSDHDFCQTVRDLKQFVIQGDVFQVVPSRRFTLPCPSPLAAYKQLKQSNPSPYMFYMQDELFTLFGASPESALKYETESNQVEIYPIAG
ncbi:MAG TPA: anthranilate synthase component I, partial [Vibrio sp.]|nr:anthranilate synthase component I [Vibrio sp.]